VLDIIGSWARGDSAEPTGRTDPQILEKLVCTNCDRVEAFVDDELVATIHPDRQTYPHLPHPPMRLPLGTERFVPSTLRLVGHLDGEVVAERRYAGDGVDRDLDVWIEHDELHADGNDLTQVSFVVTDHFGNRRRAATGVVTVTVGGPVSIVGENPFGLHAGGGAVLVRAGTTPGTATVTVEHPRLGERQVTIEVLEVGHDDR
jgi:beta-galactosidase